MSHTNISLNARTLSQTIKDQNSPEFIAQLETIANDMVNFCIGGVHKVPKVVVMDEQLRKDWIAAMKSGEYNIGMYKLRQQNLDDPEKLCYCALGVAGDLLVKKDPSKFSWTNTDQLAMVSSVGSIEVAAAIPTVLMAEHMHGDYEGISCIAYISDRWVKLLMDSKIELTTANQFMAVINYLERTGNE